MILDPAALRAEVMAHPWRSVAYAFATGAYLALVDPRARSAKTLVGALATTVIAATRDGMMRRLKALSRIDVTRRTHARG